MAPSQRNPWAWPDASVLVPVIRPAGLMARAVL